MLDRARFSPGVIDGYGGGNTARAVRAFQRAKGIAPTGNVDAALLAALRGDTAEPVVKRYLLTESDRWAVRRPARGHGGPVRG